ncbi:MAG: AMP-binding protein [Lachnoclostridium sp.]|nr:AMP-binding protein [Lachnospira sp.]MCM1248196.1 AMP-binding protein [Lachnoclostridium sp.]MCM1534479.1 AMP-binding protein [Clostridium sp.]
MQNNVLNYLNKIVKEKPDKTAYSDGTDSLSFKEVYEQSRSIGSFLHRKGIYKKPVVVFMRKSPKEVTAFFGVVTGGCFYVPIDEEMPSGRIQLILNNVQSPLIICDRDTLEMAKTFDIKEGELALYDEMAQEKEDASALEEIYKKAIDTDPIYIVFTSGSTGIPKGVAACHRSVIDYVEQLSELLDFDENTVFGNQAPLYFDACLKELYPTIKFGATAYLIPRNLFSMPVALVEYLNTHKINTICWVVSALTMVSAFDTFSIVKPEYLHTVAFGSEVFPIKQFRIWRKALPDAVFTNLYGPTEGTGMCCYYRVEREFADDEVIPVGRPFPNREILLLTEEGKQAQEGGEGEICIRGTSLTLGYYNDPVRTAEAFVQNPLNTAYPELIYKTGDIGRYNEAGELVFVSRKDYQIKHMGHRIELGEIEVNVDMLEGIHMAACIYDAKKVKIVLYFVGEMTEKELLAVLKTKLPRYMVPNKIIRLEQMPFTANGKIDRVTLKKNYENA